MVAHHAHARQPFRTHTERGRRQPVVSLSTAGPSRHRRDRSGETGTLFFGLGALLVVIGLAALAGPPIRRGRLSGRRPRAATAAGGTLEPRRPGAGFTLAAS